jgi:hypothetical protein
LPPTPPEPAPRKASHRRAERPAISFQAAGTAGAQLIYRKECPAAAR